jgi:hypothetical protein
VTEYGGGELKLTLLLSLVLLAYPITMIDKSVVLQPCPSSATLRRDMYYSSTYLGCGDDNGGALKSSSSSSSTRTSTACRVPGMLSAAAVVKDTVKLVFRVFLFPLANSGPRGSNCRLVVWVDLHEQDHRIESCKVFAYPWIRCSRVAKTGFTDF